MICSTSRPHAGLHHDANGVQDMLISTAPEFSITQSDDLFTVFLTHFYPGHNTAKFYKAQYIYTMHNLSWNMLEFDLVLPR